MQWELAVCDVDDVFTSGAVEMLRGGKSRLRSEECPTKQSSQKCEEYNMKIL